MKKKFTLVLPLLLFCLTAFGLTLENKSYFRYLDSNNLHNNDISLADPMGETPLHRAAATGDAIALKELVQDGANYQADIDGQTPLMYAIIGQHIDIAFGLIESGTSIDEKDSFQNTPRNLAVKYLTKDNADYIVGTYNLRSNYLTKFTTAEALVFEIVKVGDYYALKTIVERYNPNILDIVDPKTGNTLTHMAATSPSGGGSIQYLSEKTGMDNLAVLNNKRQTPLFVAIELGHKHLYSKLFGKEAVALFMHGENEGKLLTPYELVIKMADINQINYFKLALNNISKSKEFNLTFRIISQLELYGQPKEGMLEGLNNAATYEDFRLLQYFIDAGISFTEGYKGELPLNVAIKTKTYIVVNFMMNMGVSLDIKDGDGISARDLVKAMNETMLTDIIAGKYR